MRAAAQTGGSLSMLLEQTDPRLDAVLIVNGERHEPTQLGSLSVGPSDIIEWELTLSWSGDADTLNDVTVVAPEERNVAFAPDEESPTLANAAAGMSGNRHSLAWTLSVLSGDPGPARLGRTRAKIVVKGFEERAPFELEAAALAWTTRGTPFPVMRWLGGLLLAAALGAGGWFGGRQLRARWREFNASRPADDHVFTSGDPTAFEQAHAELASCDMKAQTGDIEGFMEKFRPIIYNFAAATEGPGVRSLTADELADHFEEVGYHPRIGALLVDALKVCERYQTTRQLPTEDTCVKLVGELRHAAVICIKRSPRGTKA